LHAVWIVGVFAVSAVVTVADNGLAYTSVAELAGSEWAGRALGVQNTLQNLTAVAVAPLLGAVIGDARYALGFGLVALFPLLAIVTTPVRAEATGTSALTTAAAAPERIPTRPGG
jgi:MFS family permease